MRGRGDDDCLGRVPFASVIAALLCWVGVTMFCFMMAQAVNASIEQARRALRIENLPWLDKVQVTFVTVAVIMALAALVLLVVGIMSTGATRTSVYQGVRARLGGRIACAVSMIFTYLLNICWLVVLSLTVVLCFSYMVFSTLCRSVGGYSETHCLNLTVIRPLLSDDASSTEPLTLCGGDLQQFCALTNTASTWYYVGYFGCVVVVLGLIHFMICLSANYAHINDGSKYMELREIWQTEENDLNAMGMPAYKPPARRPGPPPTPNYNNGRVY
uniref:M6 n=1 Tax=Plectus sambesii TaxID=2011161 RepID=A0A914V6U5_9BILA